jgi:hypothetical protein
MYDQLANEPNKAVTMHMIQMAATVGGFISLLPKAKMLRSNEINPEMPPSVTRQ